MYQAFIRVRFVVQIIVLHISYGISRRRRDGDPDWVVGPYEIAGMVYRLGEAIRSAQSVILARHPFYRFDYGWSPSTRSYPGSVRLRDWLLGPWKLGQLARQSRGFLYVSAEGFINAAYDNRHYEFRWLKRHNLLVACYFTGNDIRSPQLMQQLELETGRPNLGTYLAAVNPVFGSPGYDAVKAAIADAANKYADVVFNADTDQRSYLTGPTHPFFYLHPDDEVLADWSKFDNYSRPVVVHAPSSPTIKGTQLVRAAVSQLRSEGYEFQYIELTGVAHEQVMEALRGAHIVLNEFYSYMPGVFAVEALAAGCAVVTSADERLDPQLPAGSNRAWLATEHYEVTKHFRELLDDGERARAIAVAGHSWVLEHATTSVSGRAITEILDDALEGLR